MKTAEDAVGLLINFKVGHLGDGLKRLVNHFNTPASLASSAVFS